MHEGSLGVGCSGWLGLWGGGGVQGSESWCSIRLDVNVLCEGAVHLTAIKTVTKPRNTLPSPVS